jgi:hypothetical protein
MTMRGLTAGVVFSLLLVFPRAALAKPPEQDGSITVQQLGEAHIGAYDALNGGQYSEPIRLRLWNRGSTDCAGTLTIRNSFGNPTLIRSGGGRMNYVIVDEHNRSSVVFDPLTNRAQAIAVMIPANKSIDIQPRFVVPGDQGDRAGRYTTTVEARFRQDGSVDDELSDVALEVNVEPTVQANFVGYGTDATLDLGELKPGATGSIGLQIRGSADVDVDISSQSHGKLVQTGGAAIPYSLAVDGTQIDLTSTSSRQVNLADPARGRTVPINISVIDVDNAPVGYYRDVITFRISAK